LLIANNGALLASTYNKTWSLASISTSPKDRQIGLIYWPYNSKETQVAIREEEYLLGVSWQINQQQGQ